MRMYDTGPITDCADSLYEIADRFGLHVRLTARQRRRLAGSLSTMGPDVAWLLGVDMERAPQLFRGVPFSGRQHVARRQRVLELRRLCIALDTLRERARDTLLSEQAEIDRLSLAVLERGPQPRLEHVRRHLGRRYRGRPRH